MYLHLALWNVSAPRRTGSASRNPWFEPIRSPGSRKTSSFIYEHLSLPVKMAFRLLNLTEHKVNALEENGRHSFDPNKFHRIPGYISSSESFLPLTPISLLSPPSLTLPAVHASQFSLTITPLCYPITSWNNAWQVSLWSLNSDSACTWETQALWPLLSASLKMEMVFPFQRAFKQEYQENALCFPETLKKVTHTEDLK